MAPASVNHQHTARPRRQQPSQGTDDGSVGKLASQVARNIEAEIIQRGWPIGEMLGSEPSLREYYGVSRSVMREAVRLVEHHRVANMRRGPNGGLLVAAPDAAPAARALVIYLEYIGTSIDDLMHARLLLEPQAASLAAERISEDGIARLRQALRDEVEHQHEPGAFSQNPLHVLIGELSGNPVLQLFIDVLTRLTARYAHTSRPATKSELAESKERSRFRHKAIVDAVTGGDGGLAKAALTNHLDEVATWLHTHRVETGGNLTSEARLLEGTKAKLAEVVAARIQDEIAAVGWPVGAVLGSESELLERFDISRAVLREAARLLEYHSVARMRRGPRGGLVISAPEADASVNTMALYLDYRGVTGDDLRIARNAIEVGALGRVVARRADPQVAERLEAALAQTDQPQPPGRTGADLFHVELAESSGNPVLPLFLRIITELWARHTNSRGQHPNPGGATMIEQVREVHLGINKAILEGDESVARHRMRRHLDAVTAWYH